MKYTPAITAMLMVCLTVPAIGAEKMRIAILAMKADGVSQRIARVASNMIRNEFIILKKYTVVERNQMDLILKEQGFQQTGCTDQNCAVQLGRLMSAQKIMVGEISSLGNKLVMTVRIVDVEKGISNFAAKETALSENSLDRAATNLTRKLSGRINNTGYKHNTAYYLWGIIPGAGQLYAGSIVKGTILLSAFGALTGTFGWGAYNYYTKKDAYEKLDGSATPAEFDSKYNAYQTAGTLNIIFASLLGAVYIYNWIDLVFITDFKSGPVLARAPRQQYIYSCSVYDRAIDSRDDRRYEITFGMRF